jgi:flagellar motor switch protein FliN
MVHLPFRLSRGITGEAALLLPGGTGIGLARLLLGEAPPQAVDGPAEGDEDALRELSNQTASSVATALGECVGKPVGFEAPTARWVPEGGAGLSTGSGAVVLVLDLSVGPVAGDGYLVLPRAGVVPPPVTQVAMPPLSETAPRRGSNGLEMLLDISLPLTVELGRARMVIRDILHLAPGSVLELDKLAGEPVDIMINDRSIARGEVVVIDENFGVRLTSIVTPSERVVSLR